jgi:hypothetical protein
LQDNFKTIIEDIKSIILRGNIPRKIKVLTSINNPAIKPATEPASLSINIK